MNELLAPWPAIFEDDRGREAVTMTNDGGVLRMALRGVALNTSWLDSLEPDPGQAEAAAARFTLDSIGDVTDYRLECRIPLRCLEGGVLVWRSLRAVIEAGRRRGRGEAPDLLLELAVGEEVFASPGRSGWFEDELIALLGLLPAATRPTACLNCGLSDYSPLGNGLFGTLYCFRGAADAYRRVRSKHGIFDLWTENSGPVQETGWCSTWEPRPEGAGYRGWPAGLVGS